MHMFHVFVNDFRLFVFFSISFMFFVDFSLAQDHIKQIVNRLSGIFGFFSFNAYASQHFSAFAFYFKFYKILRLLINLYWEACWENYQNITKKQLKCIIQNSCVFVSFNAYASQHFSSFAFHFKYYKILRLVITLYWEACWENCLNITKKKTI